MLSYLTPGVYHERTDSGPPAVAVLRTDITGFVGLAERGPLDTPVPLGSMRQFRAWFGGFTGIGYLAYTVQAFFENGGRRCWVVRVASKDPAGGALPAGLDLRPEGTTPYWRIQAASPGTWGNGLRMRMDPVARAQTRATSHDTEGAKVDSITGLTRGALVRLNQPGIPTAWRVLSHVDPVTRRVAWVHPDPAARLASDRLLQGRNPDLPLWLESLEYRLRVREAGRPVLDLSGIRLVPGQDGYGPRLLAPPRPQGETDEPVGEAPAPVVIRSARPGSSGDIPAPLDIPENWRPLTGGRDGLADLCVQDFLGEPFSPLDSDTARRHKCRGLRALEEIDEIALLAVPDIQIRPYRVQPDGPGRTTRDPCAREAQPPAAPLPTELPPIFPEGAVFRVQSALVEQCERRRDRLALLDAPLEAARDLGTGLGAVQAWRQRFDTSYAAFYTPWIRVVDPLRGGGAVTRAIPPCGHVAGQYARSDLSIGVHKAPANTPLQWLQDLTLDLDGTAHGVLNPLGVNAIRALPGRGLRIYGARTLSRDPDWRFVNVRRLMMMIRKAVRTSLQWAVFEPNDLSTRLKLRLVLTQFLAWTWQQGMLAGAAMDEAFFVQCDEDNNPPEEVERGRLFLDIGVAPARPFEFVVVRLGRIDNSFETFTGAEGDPWQS